MGIEGYLVWLKTIMPSAFSPSPASMPRFDRVYVDLNGFLHKAAYRSISDSQVLNDAHRTLRTLLQRLRPRQELYVALDGAASTLKMKLQRARRLETNADWTKRGEVGISSSMFTPGTMFMGRVDTYLQERLASRIFNLKVTIDGASNQGEGELKVIQQAIQKQHGSSCIVSFDSDAIIHALCANVENLWVYNPQADILFSAQQAKAVLKNEYGIPQELLRFFCLLSNFMGNDITSRLRHGSIKVLFSKLVHRLQANKLNAGSEYEMLQQLAEVHMKMMTGTTLQLYLAHEQEHNLEPADIEKRLAKHWFLNQWLLDSVTNPNVQSDFDLESERVGPILGDVLKVSSDALSQHLQKLEMDHLAGSERIAKIPGAVALVLFDPTSAAISHLPLPLQRLASTLDPVAWAEGNCLRLLSDYTQLVSNIPKEEFTAEELRVTFAGKPIVSMQESLPAVPFIRNSHF